MSFEGLFSVRVYKPEDKNFILSTFLRGVYYGETFFSKTPKNLFMEQYKQVALGLVSSPSVLIRVACLPDEPDTVLGYAVMSKDLDTVLYAFTKERWRRRGVMKSLLPTEFKYVVPQHVTTIGRELLKNKNVQENPFF